MGKDTTEAAKPTWGRVEFETTEKIKDFNMASMAYAFGAKFDEGITKAGTELNNLITEVKDSGIDNPIVLAQISALSNAYNSGRMLQSSMIKTLKDTAQHCIRNV